MKNNILHTLPIIVICLITSIQGFNQSIFLQHDHPAVNLLDRIETLQGAFSDVGFTNSGAVSLNDLTLFMINEKADVYEAKLSNADVHEVNKYLKYALAFKESLNSALYDKSYRTNTGFYKKTDFLYQTYSNKFAFAINPKLGAHYLLEDGEHNKYEFGIGLNTFFRIGNRVGIYGDFTFNQDKFPKFYKDYTQKYKALPYSVNHQINGDTYQYTTLNTHIAVDAIRDHLFITAGYGSHFIGDGYRSLILSDFAGSYPYVSFKTKIWKFQYTNYYFKAKKQTIDYNLKDQGDNKYVALHYLSANVAKWLNIGLFETVTSVRENGMELAYWMPVIMYRSMERQLGSPDKMALGLTAKIIPFKKAQLYGQFFINEFTAKQFFSNKGYLHNKWGLQAGGKYFDLFNVDNLDLLIEMNLVRPYAYQHRSYSNFSHNNLPLAHPLGAGFKEFIFQINSRPTHRLGLNFETFYIVQALDIDSINNGSNILKNIRNNTSLYGIKLINGQPTTTVSMQLMGQYELFNNLFIELGGGYRSQTNVPQGLLNTNNWFLFSGFRFHMNRKNYWQL